MAQKDYYEILGVKKDASAEEIRKAYHQIAMKHHPDRNPGDEAAERKFKEAAEAYDVLRDPEKRKRYDQFGHAGMQGYAGREFASFEDIFEAFGDVWGDTLFEGLFGGGGSGGGGRSGRRRRGAHLRCEVVVDFKEVMNGTTREIRVDRAVPCGDCRGTGARAGTSASTCKACGGRGEVLQTRGFLSIRSICPQCRGAGSVVTSPCRACRGEGRIRKEGTLEIKIPPGVEDGTQLRLAGQGEAGENGAAGGDLFVLVRVKDDALFERQGDDVVCRVPVAFSLAALGGQIEVPTLTGKPTTMKIPAGTQTSQVFRLRDMGFPSLHHGYGRGDQLVEVVVEVPKKLTNEQERLLRDYARIEEASPGPLRKGFLDRLKGYFEP